MLVALGVLPLLSLAGRWIVRHDHGQWLHGDGFYYYAYARSVVLDGDLDFTNEYDHYRQVLRTERLTDGAGFDERRITPAGRLPNPWAVGMALFLAPFFLVGYLLELAFAAPTPAGLAGFAHVTQGCWLLGSATYGALGLGLALGLAQRYVSPSAAALCTAAVLLATNVFHYVVVATWMAHAVSLCIVAGYLYLWDRTRQNRPVLLWGVLGLVGGLAFTVRWQNALFNIVAAVEWVALVVSAVRAKDSRRFAKLLGTGTIYLTGLAIGMAPQLVAWRICYGSWLVFPQAGGSYEFQIWPRYVGHALFSTNNGLITWTPLVGLCLAGLIPLRRRDRVAGVALGLAFLLQLWINGAVSDYYGGAAFGARKFLNCTAIFVLGLAVLVEHSRPRIALRTWGILFALLAFWNGLFMLQYDLHTIPRGHPLTLRQIVLDKFLLPAQILRRLAE